MTRLKNCLPTILFATVLVLLSACHSVGPASIQRDRFDYNDVVARSWQEQILLNIVKIRYLEMPVFLDVSQVVSGYTIESTINLGGNVNFGAGSDELNLGASGKWIDRPTITYTPMTGAQFNRNLLTPIPPIAVLFMTQAGWPVDPLLSLSVQSINGVDATNSADNHNFVRAIELMQKLQMTNMFSLRVDKGTDKDQAIMMVLRAKNIDPESLAVATEVRELLRLGKDQNEFLVSYGASEGSSQEIRLLTRSLMQILLVLGNRVDVPEEDILSGRVSSARSTLSELFKRFTIHQSSSKPENAVVAVQYRERWFWIDDRDLESKKIFALVMILFNQMETGGRESVPMVTIPAG